MAESSGTEIINILDDVFKILKEEHVFDTSGNNQVIEFVHPKELQVNFYNNQYCIIH